MNAVRIGLLMSGLTGIFPVMGFLLDGQSGVIVASLPAAACSLIVYWNADRMLLSMCGAREVNEQVAPDLVQIVRPLSQVAGLPMPRVCIVDSEQPNAFATGRNPEHATLCVTSGLLHRVDNEELAGVLAHELSHVKNHDTPTMTLAATIAGAVSMLANFAFFGGYSRNRNPVGAISILLMMLVAPIVAVLVQTAVSRRREFEADRTGAQISGHPLWLASALQRIGSGAVVFDNPATERTFIINPLRGELSGLFGSHPSTEERIARLQAMAATTGQAPPPGPRS